MRMTRLLSVGTTLLAVCATTLVLAHPLKTVTRETDGNEESAAIGVNAEVVKVVPHAREEAQAVVPTLS